MMVNLTLLHTNDLHGAVHQLMRAATLVRQIRTQAAAAGGSTLYLDAGDSEETNQVESCLTRGSSMYVLLKAAGCDQVALGNSIPLRYGPQAIAALAQTYGQPLLCGNLYYNDGSLPKGLSPFELITPGGHPVGIIGMTALVSAYPIFDLQTNFPLEKAAALVEQVRAKGAKTVILLSHLGQRDDIALAETVAGIDVIVGGHSHDRISPPLAVKDTLIVQAGQYGEVLGRLDLLIDPSTGKLTNYHAELIPLGNEIDEDEQTLLAFEGEKERVKGLMQQLVGELRIPLEVSDTSECSAGDLLADALLARYPGADVSMILAGHWNTGLDIGKVTVGALNLANRSTGNPCRVELTGGQVMQFLLAALQPENLSEPRHALRGWSTGLPHVAGMRVIVHGKPPTRIELWMGKHLVLPEERLLVVTSDLEISDILNYLYIPDEKVNYELPTILPEVLEDYIRARSPIKIVEGTRIEFQ